jgi:type II secretory pathway component PulC
VSDRISYAAAWALCSALLLSLGFVAVVAIGARIAAGQGASMQQTLLAFAVYTKVVLFKGLLPALFVALALWAWLDRGGRLARRGWRWSAVGLALAATLGSVAAAAGLMPLAIPGLPPVRYTGTANFVRTCAEMAVPVALAAWLPRTLLPRLRRHAALLLAGLLVVFLAGGASVARFVRTSARALPPPAVAPGELPEAAPIDPPAPPPAPFPDAGGIPISELPLQLLATSVVPAPGRSVAFVADTERASPQLLREGDAFEFHPRVVLTRIEASRALIDNEGRTERLELNPDTAVLDQADPLADLSREEIEHRRGISQRIRQWIEAGPEATETAVVGGLLAEGDPVPVYSDGTLTGLELQNIRPDGLYARMGLRDGDRVGAINGVAIGSPDAGGELLRALVEAPAIELSVERSDGTPAEIVLPRDQLLDELRALELH